MRGPVLLQLCGMVCLFLRGSVPKSAKLLYLKPHPSAWALPLVKVLFNPHCYFLFYFSIYSEAGWWSHSFESPLKTQRI